MPTFTIDFHGPFHVGTGAPGAGLDRVVDRDTPLPASSLKGRVRAAAAVELGIPEQLVSQVFGDSPDTRGGLRRPSPWSWTDAVFDSTDVTRHARVRVTDRGQAMRGFIMLGEQVWARAATFDVDLQWALGEPDRHTHLLVLRAAARAVTSVGGGRHRGQGWVTMADSTEWTAEDTAALRVLISGELAS